MIETEENIIALYGAAWARLLGYVESQGLLQSSNYYAWLLAYKERDIV